MQSRSLRRGIGTGLILLVALMPFHAFFSVWLGSLTHHEAIIEAWKEALLVVLALFTAWLVIKDATSRDQLRSLPIYFIGLFVLVAALVTLFARPSTTAILYGTKTDMEFLIAFIIAAVVSTPNLVRALTWAILAPACLVVGFGLLEFTILSPGFLTHFGYSLSTVAPYELLGGATHIFRFPSTLGGPNQLGTYLILPFALSLIMAVRRRQWPWLILAILCLPVSLHTYSRGAWLGLAAAGIIVAFVLTPRSRRLRAGLTFASSMALVAAITSYLITKVPRLRYIVFHGTTGPPATSSDSRHLSSLRIGLDDTWQKPFGHGIGTAGPAVFHSHSGIIIENNFLQLSYETGIVGALLFLAICVAACLNLARRSETIDLSAASLAALVGISITALFLPAWTDSSTALILWTAAGASVGLSPDTRHV
jgi:O-antigen ligase